MVAFTASRATNRCFGKRRMILVAVGGLHEHEVRVFEGNGIAMERSAARSDVARKHDDLLPAAFLHRDLEARRPEDVPGFHRAHADARSDLGRVVVAQAPVERMQAVHFLLRVQRLDERLALFRAPAVLALRVLALEVRRILEDQFSERQSSPPSRRWGLCSRSA